MCKGWTQLPSGERYWPFDPYRHVPSLEDIAHKCAQTNRYGGSCIFPYSVAQHMSLGAQAIVRDEHGMAAAAAFLIHDAAEPLGFQDLPSPVKRGDNNTAEQMEFVRLHAQFEDAILDSIIDHYGISRDPSIWRIVKEYDTRILMDEKNQVMRKGTHDWGLTAEPLGVIIRPMDWLEAKNEYLHWLRVLFGDK